MFPANIPFVALQSADGARAAIAIDGAQVASWIPANSTEDRLFVSANAFYGPGASIRGGIPVIFPQFGPFGTLGQHGFARNKRWQVLSQGNGTARLELRDDEETRSRWPHAFRVELHVVVGGDTLAVHMTVENTGAVPMQFTAALHPYFAVRDAFATRVDGLAGCRYRDALRDGAHFIETSAALDIAGPLDRIYYAAPDTLRIVEADRSLIITKRGFPEAVVWNPGEAGTSGRADFVAGDQHRMLCVEAAAIEHPIALQPNTSWSGAQIMQATLRAG